MNTLTTNVGKTDKIIRLIIGIIIFVTLFAMQTWYWFIGVAIIVTALLDFCPIYKILRISTDKNPQKWWK